MTLPDNIYFPLFFYYIKIQNPQLLLQLINEKYMQKFEDEFLSQFKSLYMKLLSKKNNTNNDEIFKTFMTTDAKYFRKRNDEFCIPRLRPFLDLILEIEETSLSIFDNILFKSEDGYPKYINILTIVIHEQLILNFSKIQYLLSNYLRQNNALVDGLMEDSTETLQSSHNISYNENSSKYVQTQISNFIDDCKDCFAKLLRHRNSSNWNLIFHFCTKLFKIYYLVEQGRNCRFILTSVLKCFSTILSKQNENSSMIHSISDLSNQVVNRLTDFNNIEHFNLSPFFLNFLWSSALLYYLPMSNFGSVYSIFMIIESKFNKVKFSDRQRQLFYSYFAPLKTIYEGRELSGKYRQAIFNISSDIMPIFNILQSLLISGNFVAYGQVIRNKENFDKLLHSGTYVLYEKLKTFSMFILFSKISIYYIEITKSYQIPISLFTWCLNQNFLNFNFVHDNNQDLSMDETEGLISFLIYLGGIRGYISHEHRKLVLSKQKPFIYTVGDWKNLREWI